jgi:hypothetical protein
MKTKRRRETKRDVEMRILNERLNASEERLRARIGGRKVTALTRRFKAAAKDDVWLYLQLYAKRNPYDWLARFWAPKQRT